MSEANQDHFTEVTTEASASAAPAPDQPAEQIDPVAALIAERDEMKDRLLRSLAEADNVRKRAERDRREAEKFGGTRIVRDLLPVYDNLRRALNSAADAAGDADRALVEGVEITLRELLKVLTKHGVTAIMPEIGDRFDPESHEALFEAPVPGTKAGDILQVMAEGFMLHDRLVRPAQVGVSSNTGA
jgi:molecular chaperone GrpE